MNSKIITENIGLSNTNDTMLLTQFQDSSSSTLSKINNNSSYYKKKNKILYSNNKNFFSKIKVKIITLENYLKKKKLKKLIY